MARIRLTRSGINVDGAVRVRGDVVDVAADTAELLCSTSQAIPLDDDRRAVDPELELTQTTAARTSSRPARRRPRERR